MSLRTLLQPFFLLAHYDVDHLRKDVVAGVTTGIILVPQSIAYALIAGLPPQVGLYTAVVASVTAALWGSSHHLHTGPTNAGSLLLLAAVSPIVSPANGPEYLIVAGLLTVMTGVMRLLLGILRLGFIVNFVSDAVVVGFAAGAGMLIIVNQFGGLMGLDVESNFRLTATLSNLTRSGQPVHYVSLGLGVATFALIFVLPRLNRKLPSQFLAVCLVSLLVAGLRLDRQGVLTIGRLPPAFPALSPLPLTDWNLWQALWPGAVAITLIGLIEALTISRSLATESGQYLDNNQEMVGQGMANVVCGFLGGYCSSGSFTRSSLMYRAGGVTRMASIVSGVFVLIAVLGLGTLTQFLARPVLAGFVIATAVSMVNYRRVRQIVGTSKSETFIMLTTFGAAFLFPLIYVVAIGIAASLMVYVYKTSRPRVLPLVPTENFRHMRPVQDPQEAQCPQLRVLSIEGDLYFGAANHVEDLLRSSLPQVGDRRFVLLQLQNMVRVDISGVRVLENYVRFVREQGGDVYFFKVTELATRLFRSSGLHEFVGPDHFLDDDTAIEYLFQRVLNPKECIYDCPHRVFQECQNLPKIAIPFQDLLLANPDTSDAPLIAVDEVFARLGAERADSLVIDVREQLEWDRGHIPDARHMPYSTFDPHSPLLDRAQEIILVSNTTRRARNIGVVLREHGFRQIRILDGGMRAWRDAAYLTALNEYSPT